MKFKNKKNGKVTSSPIRKKSEIEGLLENNEGCLLPIKMADGRIVGLITDPDLFTSVVKKREAVPLSKGLSNQVFPCRSDEEVRAALATSLHSKVEVEVAGGIVRHNYSW